MKVVLSLTLTLELLVPSSAPVLAQGAEDYAPSPVVYEEYPYSIHEDGSLIYEGDLVYTCDDLPRLIGDPELPSASKALEACAELGHLPSASDDELPGTGGIPISMVVVSLALAGLAVTRSRRLA